MPYGQEDSNFARIHSLRSKFVLRSTTAFCRAKTTNVAPSTALRLAVLEWLCERKTPRRSLLFHPFCSPFRQFKTADFLFDALLMLWKFLAFHVATQCFYFTNESSQCGFIRPLVSI